MVLPHRTPHPPSPRAGSGGVVPPSCCRGSSLAAALLSGTRPMCCAVAGGLGLLVRCLGCRWGWSPQGPRPGGWVGRWSEVSGRGLRSGWTHDAAIVRRRVKASALDTGSRHQRRSVRPRAHEGRTLGALGVGRAALLPSRGTVHEKGASLPLLPRSAVDLPPVQRSEGGRSTDGPRRFLRPTRATAREPEPPPLPAARSRPLRSAGRVEAAPTQPQDEREAAWTQQHPPHPSAQYSSTLEVGPETISSSPVVTKVSAWA